MDSKFLKSRRMSRRFIDIPETARFAITDASSPGIKIAV